MERTRKQDRARASSHAAAGEAGILNPRARQRALCIAVQPARAFPSPDGQPRRPDMATTNGRPASLAELKELLRTAGVAVAGELVQHRSRPDSNNYLGSGKLEELRRVVKATGANLIACDDELLPRQERNLEQAVGLPVIDRAAIILDIFADHAASAEGKLQVELAQLEYNLARMRGLWTHLERLGGGIGTRGPGETQIETDRRLARDRIATLRRRLRRAEQTRRLSRQRREQSPRPHLALAGYTNAGKSTLMNALTSADAPVGERLFHTLDPTTRSFRFGGRTYLLTDTVGFIRKLPHQLVESFKATLEETTNASLILHVIDASVPEVKRAEMVRAVEQVLDEIGASTIPTLRVLNKIDLIDARERELAARSDRSAVLVSATSGEGLDELRNRIERGFRSALKPVDLLVPFDRGDVISTLHDVGGELEREDTDQGVHVRARVPAQVAERLRDFDVNGHAS